MSTPEKPATPMSDAQRIRVNMREWPDEMRELCRLDFARKLESALNAAREAIENAPHTEGCWQNAIHQADETSGPLKCTCWKAEALAQIDKALSPQQSKTT